MLRYWRLKSFTDLDMPRTVPITLPDGSQGTGIEVAIESSNERWSEFKLADGTRFLAKINMISVVRLQDQYDSQGMPLYQFNAQPALAVVEAPENLKRPEH